MKKGFSLIELLIYIAIISMVFGLFTQIVLSVSKSYAEIAVIRNLDTGAISAMERITREVRASSSIDAANTVLGTSPGVLSLNQVDSNGTRSTVLFKTNNQNIQMKRDGNDQGTFLPSGVAVSSLVFSSINSGNSSAVKILMQLVGTSGKITRTKNYYNTIILRGSYQ